TFVRRLERAGVAVPTWMGPQALAQHAAAQLPQHAAAIHAIAAGYIALRYAHAADANSNSAAGAASVPTLRRLIDRFRP
ncbi:MAG TPA: DUF4129 domain-containing protein, partial [Rhodocyclaceae bacterium]|nr:DUF4129 domain-containing protein [Rhodocyclaceae bacterium]